MYLHTGTSPNPGTRFEPEYADPLYLEDAIRLYPSAIFILGHTGYDSKEKALTYTDSAIYLAKRYANVYLEPGALGVDRAENVVDDFVIRLKDAGVIDKVIYGSDGVEFPGYLQSHLREFCISVCLISSHWMTSCAIRCRRSTTSRAIQPFTANF